MSGQTSIDDVHLLSEHTGDTVTPALDTYDAHSEGWTEAEHHVPLPDTESIAGYWTGDPGWVRIDHWPYHEICVILEGAIALEDSDGVIRTFTAGQSFRIPAGFTGIWHTLQPTRKIFVGIVPVDPT